MHRLVIALTTLLGLVAASYLAGYVLLFSGGTDRAAGLAPGNSVIYVTLYLQPSAGQQMNLGRQLGRLPGFADEAAMDQKIDEVAQNLLSTAGIDYRTDLKPWLGDQVSAAAWLTDADQPEQRAALIFDVGDQAAVEAAMNGFLERGGGTVAQHSYRELVMHVGTAAAWAGVDGAVVVAATAGEVRTVIDTSIDGGNLATRDDFRAAMASLPADHLAAAFVDLATIVGGASGGADGGVTNASAALVAEEEGVRIAGGIGIQPPDATASEQPMPPVDAQGEALAAWMPAETIAEVVVTGLGGALADILVASSGTPEGQQLTEAIDSLRLAAAFGFGINFDTEILPILDGEVGVALSSIEGGMPRGQLLLRPADFEAATGTLEQIADGLESSGQGTQENRTVGGVEITTLSAAQLGELSYASADGVFIIGLQADDVIAAVESRNAGSSLATRDSYRQLSRLAGGRAAHEAFADPAALLEALGMAPLLPDDARAILARLGAFGMTAEARNDLIEFDAVLTIEEPTE